MLGFQGGVSIPLVKGGVKAPPAKRQCRAGPKAGARRGFTSKTGFPGLEAQHPRNLIRTHKGMRAEAKKKKGKHF